MYSQHKVLIRMKIKKVTISHVIAVQSNHRNINFHVVLWQCFSGYIREKKWRQISAHNPLKKPGEIDEGRI